MFMLLVGYAPTKLVQLSYVDTIQDFVCELGMKPHAHLVKINIHYHQTHGLRTHKLDPRFSIDQIHIPIISNFCKMYENVRFLQKK